MPGARGAGEAVIGGEIARRGARLPEGIGDAVHGLFGDVFIKRAWQSAGGEDAPDSVVPEGAEARGVGEGVVEIGGVVTLAEQEDLASLMSPHARRAGAHEMEERGGAFAHVLEGDAELVEVDKALPAGLRMEAMGVELEPFTAVDELMAGNTGEVGSVDKELILSDAEREDVGDVIVGDGVGVALEGDEAVDGTEAVEDPGGVVGMARQRHQMLALLGEAIERGLSVAAALVSDGVDPVRELGPHVLEVDEGAAVEEGADKLPEAALDPGLGVGLAAHGAGAKLVVGGEGEEARVVDGLLSFPAEHDALLAVVGA